MKSISVELQAHLDGTETTLAKCCKILRRDGEIVAGTDHDRDLVINADGLGNVSYAAGAYSSSALDVALGLSSDIVDLQGLLDDELVSEEDLSLGRYDSAEVKLFLVNWADLTQGPLKLYRGRLGKVTRHRTTYVAELFGLMHAYSQSIGELYTPDCRADLGDSRCKVALAPALWTAAQTYAIGSRVTPIAGTPPLRQFRCTTAGTSGGSQPGWDATIGNTTSDGSVVWTTERALTIDAVIATVTPPLAGENGPHTFTVTPSLADFMPVPVDSEPWFAGGSIQFVLGPNEGVLREIKTFDPATSRFTVFLSFPTPIQVGDPCTLTVGCSKRREVCIAKFDNIVNMRAEPFLPGMNEASDAPIARAPTAANSGSSFWGQILTVGLTIIGAVAGAYLGSPALGAQLGAMVGSVLSASFFGPGAQDGPRLGDLRAGGSSYGQSIMIAYGTAIVPGTVIWQRHITEKSQEKDGLNVFSYYGTFAVGLCEGPIAQVRKIWLDTKLAFDASSTNEGIISKRLGDITSSNNLLTEDELESQREAITQEVQSVRSALRIYFGTETELPSPLIESYEGVGQVPADRGKCKLEFQDLPLLAYGNHLPLVRAEVLTKSAPAFPKRIVTSSGSFSRDQFLLDTARQYIWGRQGDRIIQLNALDNTIIQDQVVDTVDGADGQITTGISLGQAMATAADGDGVYVPVGGPSSFFDRLARLDPVTLEATHVGKKIVFLGDLCTIVIADLGACVTIRASQHYVWWGGFAGADALYCFIKPPAMACGELVDDFIMSGEYLFGPNDLNTHPRMIAIDRDETAWVICRSLVVAFNPSTLLVHMESGGIARTYDLTGTVKAASWIAYDALTHSLIILGYADTTSFPSRVIQWDIATESVTKSADGITFGAYINSSFQHGVVGRHIWTANDFRFFAFDVDTFTQVRVEDVLGPGAWGGGFHYAALFDQETNALWAMEEGAPFAKYFMDRLDAGVTTLAEIVEDISSRVGLTPETDLVTTELTDTVWGYVLSRRSSARGDIEPVLMASLVDAVESDWKIRFRQRGNLTPVAALTAENLGAHSPTESAGDVLTIERLADIDLPIRLDVTYQDPARDYQDANQHARRMQAPQYSREQRTVQTPVLMEAQTAKTLAEQSLTEAWSQREAYSLRLPYRWTTLDPSDVITALDPVTERTHLLRFTSMQHGANGIIEARGVSYDRSAYVASDALGTETDFAPQVLLRTALTKLFLLDINMLRDVDDTAGFYVAGAPDGAGEWPGAVVYQSAEGVTFDEYEALNTAVVWGVAVTALPNGSPYVFDRESTVDVRFINGVPSSSTELGVLNRANGLLLGDEILQFATATLLTGAIYRLSTLLRGRRGTEWATGTHRTGDQAILVKLNSSDTAVHRGGMTTGEIGSAFFYKGVTLGDELVTTPVVAFTNTAAGLKPYAPDHVRGVRDGSNNLTITWVRRTRVGGEWRDAVDVPLVEASEAYEADVFDGADIVRTLTSTTPTVTYSAAQQTADGLTPGDPISVIVYQLSAIVGRGYSRAATV